MNKILAIDPGYDRCGFAMLMFGQGQYELKYSDCIITSKKDLHQKRIADVFSQLKEVIEKENPDYIALENLFFSNNKKTAIKVAEARGLVVLLSGLYNIPLLEISPQEVKIAMTGVGNASKEQVQKMVELTLKIDTKNILDDEIDAIAVAFAGAQKQKINTLNNL